MTFILSQGKAYFISFYFIAFPYVSMYIYMSPISWLSYVYTVSDTSCDYINVGAFCILS